MNLTIHGTTVYGGATWHPPAAPIGARQARALRELGCSTGAQLVNARSGWAMGIAGRDDGSSDVYTVSPDGACSRYVVTVTSDGRKIAPSFIGRFEVLSRA